MRALLPTGEKNQGTKEQGTREQGIKLRQVNSVA
jgi:hypothetical protein